MTAPLISVILPVYNGEQYIYSAIQSILTQTYKQFELVVLDDGSTDRTKHIVEGIKDSRLILKSGAENKGLVFRLNEGMKMTQGKYIVRMDADDISLPDRFSQLLDFMERNREVGICGSYVKVFGNLEKRTWKMPLTDKAIKAALPFRTPFVHPSVIMRAESLNNEKQPYKDEFFPAEDYELWCNMSGKTRFANIPLLLLKYRVHGSQISGTKKRVQQVVSDKIRAIYFQDLFPEKSAFALYQRIVNEELDLSADFLKESIYLFQNMEMVNKDLNKLDSDALKKELSFQAFKIATHLSTYKIRTLKIFKASPYFDASVIPPLLLFKYYIKQWR